MAYGNVGTLVGRTFYRVENTRDEIRFFGNDMSFHLYHVQDCCEDVYVEDVCGDLADLENTPILQAEEVSGEGVVDETHWGEAEWTFYKIATIKGYVTIRFVGYSEYYSTAVSFAEMPC